MWKAEGGAGARLGQGYGAAGKSRRRRGTSSAESAPAGGGSKQLSNPRFRSLMELTQASPASPRPGDSFAFLRLVLALLVVFGHCFPLGGFNDALVASLTGGQVSPDNLAVKSFFVLSGFLLA